MQAGQQGSNLDKGVCCTCANELVILSKPDGNHRLPSASSYGSGESEGQTWPHLQSGYMYVYIPPPPPPSPTHRRSARAQPAGFVQEIKGNFRFRLGER